MAMSQFRIVFWHLSSNVMLFSLHKWAYLCNCKTGTAWLGILFRVTCSQTDPVNVSCSKTFRSFTTLALTSSFFPSAPFVHMNGTFLAAADRHPTCKANIGASHWLRPSALAIHRLRDAQRTRWAPHSAKRRWPSDIVAQKVLGRTRCGVPAGASCWLLLSTSDGGHSDGAGRRRAVLCPRRTMRWLMITTPPEIESTHQLSTEKPGGPQTNACFVTVSLCGNASLAL